MPYITRLASPHHRSCAHTFNSLSHHGKGGKPVPRDAPLNNPKTPKCRDRPLRLGGLGRRPHARLSQTTGVSAARCMCIGSLPSGPEGVLEPANSMRRPSLLIARPSLPELALRPPFPQPPSPPHHNCTYGRVGPVGAMVLGGGGRSCRHTSVCPGRRVCTYTKRTKGSGRALQMTPFLCL